jgi:MoxR-like ATPase
VLLEGQPGTGKRLAAQALAASIGAEFSEAHTLETPADNLAHLPGIWNPASAPAGEVRLLTGLHQASPRAQARLAHAMDNAAAGAQPGSTAGQGPLMLIASRQANDVTGALPLSEGLADRFALSITLDFPGLDDEARLVREIALSASASMLDVAAPDALLNAAALATLRRRSREVKVADALVAYAVSIVRATRFAPLLTAGASPRAAIALVRCAQARALLQGRDYSVADDVKAMAGNVLSHRVRLADAPRLDGLPLRQVLSELLDQVAAPRP